MYAGYGAASCLTAPSSGPKQRWYQTPTEPMRLMHNVFAHAEERDMDVYFAVDVDTASANPQAVIATLPREARFPITVEQMRWMNQQGGKFWLPNPDTPEGYRYYKAQVKALLNAYPQIDCLVVWFRHGNTPWMAMKAIEMPESWQKEYRDELEKTPEAAKLWRSHNFFALGKIVMAFERALKEAGRDNIQIAVGSWRFDFLPGCDRFLFGAGPRPARRSRSNWATKPKPPKPIRAAAGRFPFRRVRPADRSFCRRKPTRKSGFPMF